MSKYPPKSFPFYSIIIGALFLLLAADSGTAQEEKLSLMQNEARVYRELGLEAQKEGRLQESLAYYQKAIVMDPQYPLTYNDAGVILEGLDHPELAKAMYLKAIEVAPNYPDSYSNLAIIYEDEGNYTDAATCWMKRATLGPPNDPWAEAARRRIGDIAKAYPEAYNVSSQQYQQGMPQLNAEAQKASGSSEEQLPPSKSLLTYLEPQHPLQGRRPTVAYPSSPADHGVVRGAGASRDNKTRASNYLMQARENFNTRNYVVALKEATVAEYLDPENSEISSFVEEIRKKLLE
ncbi:MAG: tetratricopeptide repeat protein [Candidatus Omnitrophota bacterium]